MPDCYCPKCGLCPQFSKPVDVMGVLKYMHDLCVKTSKKHPNDPCGYCHLWMDGCIADIMINAPGLKNPSDWEIPDHIVPKRVKLETIERMLREMNFRCLEVCGVISL